ncbi:Acyl-CoA synthetase (AMP-forming)/AMP-acid ligase II [Cruoricaptor ignavus]|uniref:Acyl-CoA synthetase (AMP-forming)/AMP-acid ligase II n=1 Tax=Cruoricaptor ignavus TaxID=1118202 RepID=A0A1M6BHM1_9FLAO|nr:fatty acid--CoA ligase family protein [Cruoricaptor ignavus]SHI48234.1 Acyl-CoA synthetase (AMP-forming)/AMP-acid ligase II [Cruoricaptor ignavus]
MITRLTQHEGTAIITDYAVYSYQQLYDKILAYKEELSQINKGEVVGIFSDYSFESIALFLALSTMPVIAVPIVPTTDAELQNKLNAASVQWLLSISNGILNFEKTGIEYSEIDNYKNITDKNQSGLVLFSSGTTGTPKVMVHNLSQLMDSFAPPKKTRNLNFLLFLLFDHIGGINTLLNCLNSGAAITIPSNRNPEYILQLISEKKIQILPTSPTFLNLMLMTENFNQYDLSSLKMITYGTERMPQNLLLKVKEKMPKVKLLQTFGTSETGILKTESKSSTSLYFKIIDPDYDYRIEDGQLYLKSKNVVNGYLNQDSQQFLGGGWFATGDLIETDEDGYIKIIGRLNKVINVGGQKVLPKEVEDVINKVPGVVDSTVFARDNAITGQMVCAEIVKTKDSEEAVLKKEILTYCRQELDKYKVPSKIIFADALSFSNRFKKTK